jgi:hypothetical protein
MPLKRSDMFFYLYQNSNINKVFIMHLMVFTVLGNLSVIIVLAY